MRPDSFAKDMIWWRSHARPRALGFPCRFIEWDPESDNTPNLIEEGLDAVIHLSGESIATGRWSVKRKRQIRDSRVLGTRKLMKALEPLARAKALRVISASAIGYYGPHDDEELDETAPSGKGFLAEVCREWESEALGADLPGAKVSCIRIGVVLGRGSGALPELLKPFRAGLGGPAGTGRQWMSWIHYDDLIGIFCHTLTSSSPPKILNATAPYPVTNEEFSKTLARTLGQPAFFRAPAFALKAALGEMSSLVLEGQRVLPRASLSSGFRFRFETLEPALRDILPEADDVFASEQWIPRPPGEIFKFFSDAANLERITPPWIGFHITAKSTPEIQKGTLLDYKLKIHGLPVRWRTLINEWNPGQSFVDTQLKGPYTKWHHTHEFEALRGGTLMKDIVRYRVPLGGIGAATAGGFVRRDIEMIFGYRRKVIQELYGA